MGRIKQATPSTEPPPKKPGKQKLGVAVVDNDPGTRESLKFLLESKRIPVTTFASARDFLARWNPERTGCVVVDVRMPEMDGCELQAELTRRHQLAPLILMTGYSDIPIAVEAMRRGAFHFFEKPMDYLEVLETITRGIARNEEARLEVLERQEFEARYATCTSKEKQVAESIQKGLKTQEIADLMGIVSGTVEQYRGRLFEKLHCQSVVELVRILLTRRAKLEDT